MKTNTLDWANGPQLSNLSYSQKTEWIMSDPMSSTLPVLLDQSVAMEVSIPT